MTQSNNQIGFQGITKINKYFSVILVGLMCFNVTLCSRMLKTVITQLTRTCSKFTIETLEKGVKYVQSLQ